MHKVKSNGTIKRLLENTDITQGTFSWKDTHNNLKLVTGKWAPGQNEPTWTCQVPGTYFISGSIAGQLGYHQLQLQASGTGSLAQVGDFSETVRGVMVQVTALVHLNKGQTVKLYVHCPTAGIELDTDLWIYNIFKD